MCSVWCHPFIVGLCLYARWFHLLANSLTGEPHRLGAKDTRSQVWTCWKTIALYHKPVRGIMRGAVNMKKDGVSEGQSRKTRNRTPLARNSQTIGECVARGEFHFIILPSALPAPSTTVEKSCRKTYQEAAQRETSTPVSIHDSLPTARAPLPRNCVSSGSGCNVTRWLHFFDWQMNRNMIFSEWDTSRQK